MLVKIRQLKVKQTIEGLFEKNEILYEYLDRPGYFYSNNYNHDDIFSLKTMCQYGGFDMWFEELESIEKEKSPQYKLINTK